MRKDRSSYEIDERAADALMLLQHPLIEEAMASMHNTYISVLVGSPIGSPQAITAQAGLQAIEGIRSYLESVVNDQKVNQKYKGNNGHG